MRRKTITIESLFRRLPNGVNKKKIRSLAQKIFTGEQIGFYELTLICIDTDYTVMLNRKFLNKNETTDVIAFPLSDADDTGLEGEVYVNVDQARIQAAGNNCPVDEEVYRLCAHGILHLCGYDDLQKDKRAVMFERQECYIRKFSYK